MLNRLRNPGCGLRGSLLPLLCAAVFVRALVPVGYMLGEDAPAGHFAVLLCPAHAELPAGNPARAGAADLHQGHAEDTRVETHDARIASCGFALAFVPLTAPPASTADLLVDIRVTRFIESAQPAPAGITHPAFAARGPPAYS